MTLCVRDPQSKGNASIPVQRAYAHTRLNAALPPEG